MKIKVPYSKGIEIYNKSPLWMKDIFSIFTEPIPRSMMFGSTFNDYYKMLDKTQWYKPDELIKMQEKKLRALIKHAYFNVPYYHKLFRDINLSYEDIRTIDDLKKIPTLTKDDIRNNFNDLIATNAKDYKYGIGKTSGSTGKPLKFLLDQQNREIEYALVWRQLKWAGVGLNAKIATFRGDLAGEKNALWKKNALSKELVFNTYQMNYGEMDKIIGKLKTYKPSLVKGFPSSIYVLATYMRENGVDNVKPLAIQTSSELFSKSQRKVIQDQFGCEIFDWYGHSEYAVSAGECECHEGHHINAESGIVEFLKDNEKVDSEELGEIIATGLDNYSMPIIRYKTSDIASYTNELCNCGRGLQIMKSLEGRISDVITSSSGKTISGAAFEHYWKHNISIKTPNIEYVHIVQKTKNKLLVEMVSTKPFSEVENNHILKELSLLLGNDIDIEFKELEVIPTGQKWRFTESEICTDSF